MHAFRNVMVTKLGDLGCPTKVSEYVTGHAAPNVARTYGKVDLETALRFLDQIDFQIPKWKP